MKNNCTNDCNYAPPCEKTDNKTDIYTWKLKKLQFLESTGIHKVCEPNKLFITKAIVGGPTKQLDVTCALQNYNNQNNCPIDCLYVDTGKLNIYPGCDVEFGYRKTIQIEYIADEHPDQPVTIEQVQMFSDSCDKPVCPPSCTKPCCKPVCPPSCTKPCCKPVCPPCCTKPCCKPVCPPSCTKPCCKPVCPPSCTKPCCKPKRNCDKCRKRKKRCECHLTCDTHKIKMSNMLYIPLYPLARAYTCPISKKCGC